MSHDYTYMRELFHRACSHPVRDVKLYDFNKRHSWVVLQLCSETPQDGDEFGKWEIMMIEAQAVVDGWNDDWKDGDDPYNMISVIDTVKKAVSKRVGDKGRPVVFAGV